MSSSSVSASSFFAKGNKELVKDQPVLAVQHYLQGAAGLGELHVQFEGNLARARRAYRRQRQGLVPRLAVCGWSLSHNPAGRVMALADAYRHRLVGGRLAAVDVIGVLFSRWGEKVWAPLDASNVPCHALYVDDDADFLSRALHFVGQHPYDIVHLSKPRLPNLVLGMLYQLIWGAEVVWDVDDEELAFAGGAKPLSITEAQVLRPSLPVNEPLHKPFWTQLCVGELSRFSVASVSNPALQQRYGGQVLPHVRNHDHFVPSTEKRQRARSRFNIPPHARVVIFMGTPREHKGLLETAQGLASLQRDDVWLVIAGSFPDDKAGRRLKASLEEVQGIHLRWLEDQPFSELPDVLAMGDYCVLLQEAESLVAQFQLPAKLMDALAMGLVVLARVTPATQWLADAGVITPVSLENFPAIMQQQLEVQDDTAQRRFNRQYFAHHLSIAAVQPQLQAMIAKRCDEPVDIQWSDRLQGLLAGSIGALLD